MAHLQIKYVPDGVHDELRRRARLAGTTMRDYVLRLIVADQATPSRDEWLARIRARPRIDLEQPVVDLIAADRRARYGATSAG